MSDIIFIIVALRGKGRLTLESVPAKSILSGWGSGDHWFAANYNMNLYRGCCHGCIYCDSRSMCYGIDRFDTVRVKADALTLLERELRGKRRRGIVGLGAMSDSYNPFERDELLTRGALQLLAKYRFGVTLETKSDLAVRDIDLFRELAKNNAAAVSFTVTTADDDLCRRIEQRVCPTSRRIAALGELRKNGIMAGVLLMPILPFINDTEENILTVTQMAADAGAQWVFAWGGFGVTLRQNQRQWFYDRLDEQFPGVKARYIARFGESYECLSPESESLFDLFCERCESLGLLWRMEDIVAKIRAAQPQPPTQTSIFDGLQ